MLPKKDVFQLFDSVETKVPDLGLTLEAIPWSPIWLSHKLIERAVASRNPSHSPPMRRECHEFEVTSLTFHMGQTNLYFMLLMDQIAEKALEYGKNTPMIYVLMIPNRVR